MTDFNKEFDLLQRWINYRVDWYATYLVAGRSFYIDALGMPTTTTPERVMELFMQVGIMFVNSNDTEILNEHECLTFEQFKANNL